MAVAKAQAPAKPKAAPLDYTRQENVADKNDPRFAGIPCNRQHDATTVISNQFSEIAECSKCALRLAYVPRVGCTGRYRQKERLPAHVGAAIQAMQVQQIPFTNKIVKALLDRVDADIRLGAGPKQPQQQQHAAAAAPPPGYPQHGAPPINSFVPAQQEAPPAIPVPAVKATAKPPPPVAKHADRDERDAPMEDRATVVAKKWMELIEQMNPKEDIKAATRIRAYEGKMHVRALQAALAVKTPVPGI